MVISGLWHGAAWKFVIWGAIHAVAIMATRRAERSAWYREHVPRFPKQLAVFVVVCIAWVFFRAENVGDAWSILQSISSGAWRDPAFPLIALLLVSLIWAYQFLYESPVRHLLQFSVVRVTLVIAMILYLLIAPGSGGTAFIYFQF